MTTDDDWDTVFDAMNDDNGGIPLPAMQAHNRLRERMGKLEAAVAHGLKLRQSLNDNLISEETGDAVDDFMDALCALEALDE